MRYGTLGAVCWNRVQHTNPRSGRPETMRLIQQFTRRSDSLQALQRSASNSTDPLFYAIKRGPATIIVLSAYSAYGKCTPQYVWLTGFLPTMNRTVTPWVMVLVQSLWYKSNTYHYMEGETMGVEFEASLIQYSVDVVYAGHVHSYERTYPVSNIKYDIVNGLCSPTLNPSAPIYVTFGDGDNIEGIAGIRVPNIWEASFGHAELQIFDRIHAIHTWHRNQNGEKAVADSAILLNTYYTEIPLQYMVVFFQMRYST